MNTINANRKEIEKYIPKKLCSKLYLDYDKNNFKCVDNVLTIPDKILRNSRKSKLLNEMIKSYNGTTWDYEFLNIADFSDLPHNLL